MILPPYLSVYLPCWPFSFSFFPAFLSCCPCSFLSAPLVVPGTHITNSQHLPIPLLGTTNTSTCHLRVVENCQQRFFKCEKDSDAKPRSCYLLHAPAAPSRSGDMALLSGFEGASAPGPSLGGLNDLPCKLPYTPQPSSHRDAM